MSYFGSAKLIDENGTPYGVKQIDNKPRVSSMPYLYDIAEGNISNHTAWSKIGYTPTMTTKESDIWSKAGTYVFPTSASSMAVSSSDSTQDIASGSGARKVTIYYLDDNYNSLSEELTLSGSVLVKTSASNILRVNAFRVTSAGVSGSPKGNISLTNPGGTVTYSYISAGYTRARNSAYTVPSGSNLYITGGIYGYGYSTNQTHYCRMYLRATQNGLTRTPGLFYPQVEVIVANSSNYFELTIPAKVVEKVDIKVSGVSTFSGIASCELIGWTESI